MTQIKIEVPANDTIALNAFAEALQRIAAERDDESVFTGLVEQAEKNLVESSEHAEGFEYEVDDEPQNTKQSAWENLPPEDKDGIEEDSCVGAGLDADGIPWDKRIHSKGKSRLADDTWRLRKRPTDKDEDEWTTYIDTVKAELKAVQDIPVEPTLDEQPSTELEGVTPNGDTVTVPDDEAGEPCPPVTPPTLSEDQAREEIKEQLEAGEVVIQAPTEPVTPPSTVIPPVEAVTPPASLTPPASAADEPTVKTFPELMKYITTSAAKRGANNDMIKEVLLEVDASLTAIPLIANRVDLIPTFVEKLEVRLA